MKNKSVIKGSSSYKLHGVQLKKKKKKKKKTVIAVFFSRSVASLYIHDALNILSFLI